MLTWEEGLRENQRKAGDDGEKWIIVEVIHFDLSLVWHWGFGVDWDRQDVKDARNHARFCIRSQASSHEWTRVTDDTFFGLSLSSVADWIQQQSGH